MDVDSGQSTAGNREEEYKDISANMRMYAGMRFALLSVFGAFTAGFLALALGRLPQPSTDGTALPQVPNLLKLLILVPTAVLAVIEQRATDYFHELRKRAVLLEEELGFEQYRFYQPPPRARIISATVAARVLYLGALILWIVWLLKPEWLAR
jgi:hypothetical protein